MPSSSDAKSSKVRIKQQNGVNNQQSESHLRKIWCNIRRVGVKRARSPWRNPTI
ncbi:hypothetical protein ACE1B6_16830 [Aerosakkonemataceae cyanobacterium BLCC-F154]|uniref:Uncharacterized protein n=1 Tax=Floridaenema fluviatile BLCC-F154 TaxID=3153640 RepID=A0ABV4YDK4_9CYAN